MKIRVILLKKGYQSGNPYCTPYNGPYQQNDCEEVRLGMQAAEWKMQTGDAQSFWTYNLEGDLGTKIGATKDGTLVFVDVQNDLALYKLEPLYVTRANVQKVMEFLWNFEYQDMNGEPGFITADGDGKPLWFPAADLNNPDWATKFGMNPYFSILEYINDLFETILDAADKLIPWWLYVVGAGYLGMDAVDEKNKGKQFIKGAGAAFLGYRAAKSATK